MRCQQSDDRASLLPQQINGSRRRIEHITGCKRRHWLLFTAVEFSERDKWELRNSRNSDNLKRPSMSKSAYGFAVLLTQWSQRNKYLICTKMVFSGGSFGAKWRGNLLVTEVINPEETQWWCYRLRCCGKHHQGRERGGRAMQGEQYQRTVNQGVYVYMSLDLPFKTGNLNFGEM